MEQFQQGMADMFKAFGALGEFKAPTFDVNSLFATQRSTAEALSTAGQIVTENAQTISREQTEVLRSNVETFLGTTRDILTGDSPEANTAKQAELTRTLLGASMASLHDTIDQVTASQFAVFELFQQRAAENLETMGKTARKAA